MELSGPNCSSTTVHLCTVKTWFSKVGVYVLMWPARHPDLNTFGMNGNDN